MYYTRAVFITNNDGCLSAPPSSHQYTAFLESPRPNSSIPCYNTQVNAIKRLLHYQETISCVVEQYYVKGKLDVMHKILSISAKEATLWL